MYSLAHWILKNLNPETAHNLSIQGLKLGLYPKVNFKNTINIVSRPYFRRFKYKGTFYGMAMPGFIYKN